MDECNRDLGAGEWEWSVGVSRVRMRGFLERARCVSEDWEQTEARCGGVKGGSATGKPRTAENDSMTFALFPSKRGVATLGNQRSQILSQRLGLKDALRRTGHHDDLISAAS